MSDNKIAVLDHGLITKKILTELDGDTRLRSEVIHCESAQQAMDILSSKKADFILVLTEDNEPIPNIVEYISTTSFEEKTVPMVLFYKDVGAED